MKSENQSIIASLVGIALLIGAIAIWQQWPAYGPIGQAAYPYALALTSACGRQDGDTIEQISADIDTAFEQEELNPTERDWLQGIVETAQAGHWDSAYQEARTLLNAQAIATTN